VSSVTTMLDAGLYWQDQQFVEGYGGRDLKRFRIDGRLRPAISLPSSEHLFLPRVYPHLEDINVYVGWFGWYSYLMKQVSKVQSLVLKAPMLRRTIDAALPLLLKSEGRGPNAEERALAGSHIVAMTYDKEGRQLARAELTGDNPYSFTAAMMAWGAQAILDGRLRKYGALGPVGAFGLDALIDGCESSGLQLK